MLSTWASWCCFSTILVVHAYSSPVLASSSSCPTWFYYSNTTQECKCVNLVFVDQINCNQKEMKAEIADGFCATYAGKEGHYYAGKCPYRHMGNNTNRLFSTLPCDPGLLNDMMCGTYNRKGLLCGKCIDGYGPAVYSLDMKCTNCSRLSTGYAVSLYLLLEFIPITLFFMCVIIFRFNITAGPLLGYVLFCQVYVFKVQQDLFQSHVSAPLRVLVHSSLALSGTWTLQFFRFLVPPFCMSEKLTDIHIQMLSLVTSIYPIVLVVTTCVLMELHARNYRFIYILWKPFSTIFNKFKITSVTSDGVIHAFATLSLLMACSLTSNASIVTQNNPLFQTIGDTFYRKHVLYFDPTITWLSHKCILYMLALAVPFIFLVLIPSLLLCVYPTRIYNSLSRFVSVRKRLAITAFAETLHNCFKDGLNGTRDYRALAGLIIPAAIVSDLISIFIGSYVLKGYSFRLTGGLLMMFFSLILSYMRPCKFTIANLSLSYHVMMVGIL